MRHWRPLESAIDALGTLPVLLWRNGHACSRAAGTRKLPSATGRKARQRGSSGIPRLFPAPGGLRFDSIRHGLFRMGCGPGRLLGNARSVPRKNFRQSGGRGDLCLGRSTRSGRTINVNPICEGVQVCCQTACTALPAQRAGRVSGKIPARQNSSPPAISG